MKIFSQMHHFFNLLHSKANWFLTGNPQEGGFQHYTMCTTNHVAHLPPDVPFTAGCVLPLSINTAAMGLYPPYRFALPFPQVKPKALKKSPSRLVRLVQLW
jgi:NADPH:quinone reductase-like Zn-dependent oxidoreductase